MCICVRNKRDYFSDLNILSLSLSLSQVEPRQQEIARMRDNIKQMDDELAKYHQVRSAVVVAAVVVVIVVVTVVIMAVLVAVVVAVAVIVVALNSTALCCAVFCHSVLLI